SCARAEPKPEAGSRKPEDRKAKTDEELRPRVFRSLVSGSSRTRGDGCGGRAKGSSRGVDRRGAVAAPRAIRARRRLRRGRLARAAQEAAAGDSIRRGGFERVCDRAIRETARNPGRDGRGARPDRTVI